MISERGEAYAVRVYRGKERGYEWIGTFRFKDHGGKRSARKAAEQAEAEALNGARWARRMTIGEYVDRYLDDYEERTKDSTYDTARTKLRIFKREFGDRRLEDGVISRREADDWSRAHRSCVPVVITLFNRAIRDEELSRNPFAGLSRRGRGRRDKVPLSSEDVEALVRHAHDCHGRYGYMMEALIRVAAATAMRPGELFGLEWRDIDFERMRIRVSRRIYKGRFAVPKNGRARDIVLTPHARDALLALPRTCEYVFGAKRGGRFSQPLLSLYWSPIANLFGERADKNGRLALVAFYELRHRAAYWMYVELQLHERLVAAQLGHTDGGKLIRELYGHGDHGALAEIDRYFVDNVVPLRVTAARVRGSPPELD